MSDDIGKLWTEANRYLQAQQPETAICYLAELVSRNGADRLARMTLAIALGQAGNPHGGLKIMRALAERLVHDGHLLPAIVVILHGLHLHGEDGDLLATLRKLHVGGKNVKAGQLAKPPPPPLPKKAATAGTSAAELLASAAAERLRRAEVAGLAFPPAGPPAAPAPMPLFGELEGDAFVETARRLHYRRVPPGTKLIEEGAPGESLLIMVSGQASVAKGTTVVGQVPAGAVLGEMALITHAPRSATVTATELVEVFELGRNDVGQLAKAQPKVLQELVDYCRRRLLLNLLRTSPLFANFDENTRVALLGRFQTITYTEGQEIIAQGTPGQGLYVIATGNVQVQITSDVGETVIVGQLKPGDVFGEISLLKNQPTTASVLALGTVGALFLPAADFQQMVAAHPQVRGYLEGLTADRLKASRNAFQEAGILDPDDLVVL